MNLSRRSLFSVLAGFVTSQGISREPAESDRKRPPNFIILLADDLGYGDLGCYGSSTIRTPHIDRMASEGVCLKEFYAMPTCTPARAALLTGRYPVRSGLTRVLIPKEHFGMPPSETTIAESMKTRGYRTACIGKWHLGSAPRYRPNLHGFDEFYGLLYSNDMTLPVVNWPPVKLFQNGKSIESPARQSTLTERFTAEALKFIDSNKANPFLLYLPYTMPHLPWSASRDFAGQSERGGYGDAVEELDWSVGRIMSAVSKHGLDNDTVIIFLSDNGPELAVPKPGGSAGAFRGGKGSTWEGGVRVPCVIRWPGRVSAGVAKGGITCLMDVFATCLELSGAKLPDGVAMDGGNLIPFLNGGSDPPHDEFCYYFGVNLCAFRSGPWKVHMYKRERRRKGGYRQLVACRPPELYNLHSDPAETRNVYADHPAIAAGLIRRAAEVAKAIQQGKRAPSRWRSLLPGPRPSKPKRRDSL